MAFTVPTVADFQTKFTNFSVVPDATIQAAIDEASLTVGAEWLEKDAPRAILYLSAHILSMDGEPENSGGTSTASAAAIKKEVVGDVEIEYAVQADVASGANSIYQRTYYGQRYLELLRRNFPAVAVA